MAEQVFLTLRVPVDHVPALRHALHADALRASKKVRLLLDRHERIEKILSLIAEPAPVIHLAEPEPEFVPDEADLAEAELVGSFTGQMTAIVKDFSGIDLDHLTSVRDAHSSSPLGGEASGGESISEAAKFQEAVRVEENRTDDCPGGSCEIRGSALRSDKSDVDRPSSSFAEAFERLDDAITERKVPVFPITLEDLALRFEIKYGAKPPLGHWKSVLSPEEYVRVFMGMVTGEAPKNYKDKHTMNIYSVQGRLIDHLSDFVAGKPDLQRMLAADLLEVQLLRPGAADASARPKAPETVPPAPVATPAAEQEKGFELALYDAKKSMVPYLGTGLQSAKVNDWAAALLDKWITLHPKGLPESISTGEWGWNEFPRDLCKKLSRCGPDSSLAHQEAELVAYARYLETLGGAVLENFLLDLVVVWNMREGVEPRS